MNYFFAYLIIISIIYSFSTSNLKFGRLYAKLSLIKGGASTVDNEYYDILGLKRRATESDIKKAYRTKAMDKHPDRGGDAEEFKKLAEAYEVFASLFYDKLSLSISSDSWTFDCV